jgi:predicted N-formylglutamate amidohydrolase
VHSFTAVFKTVARLWHVGVLYNRDPRFAQILMELLHREEGRAPRNGSWLSRAIPC